MHKIGISQQGFAQIPAVTENSDRIMSQEIVVFQKPYQLSGVAYQAIKEKNGGIRIGRVG